LGGDLKPTIISTLSRSRSPARKRIKTSRNWCISINLAQRITLELLIRDQEVVLVNVGSHDAVYR